LLVDFFRSSLVASGQVRLRRIDSWWKITAVPSQHASVADRMNRRAFIATATALLVAPLAAGAQQAAKVPRIGFLGNSTAALEANLVGPFREGLRDLGYVEGHSILIEYRWAEGSMSGFLPSSPS
jgi:hypothetical protein